MFKNALFPFEKGLSICFLDLMSHVEVVDMLSTCRQSVGVAAV